MPLPEPVSTQIEGLRIALGDPALGTTMPHITLVPPVNVREDTFEDATRLIRSLASHPPVTTRVGPVATFAPANPVLYLEVAEANSVARLRDRVFRPPLSRPLSHDFVPHITIMRSASEHQVEHAPGIIRYTENVELDRVLLLQESVDAAGRRWLPIMDVILGSETIAGRGGIETVLTLATHADPGVHRILGSEVDADNFVVATQSGAVVGAVAARRHGSTLAICAVGVDLSHRDSGIGRALVRRLQAVAAESESHAQRADSLAVEHDQFLRHLGI